jgi:REP-associated tyrosine transposase
LDGRDDELVTVSPLLEMAGDWKLFLGHPNQGDAEKIRGHERTGRALGNEAFLNSLEAKLVRAVKPRKPGRKRRPKDEK